jgi:hypothetical protein
MSEMKACAPMGRLNLEDDFATGYMCLIDFECELGNASGGNIVYPSIQDLRERRECVATCGIVEVEVRARRIVQEPVEPVWEDAPPASGIEAPIGDETRSGSVHESAVGVAETP